MQNEYAVGSGLFQIVKGVALGLAVALLSTVIFAWVLQYAPMAIKWVYIVNQIIKLVSVAVGVTVCVQGEKGYLKGGAIALLFTALSYLTFAALGGDFSLGWMVLVELILAVATGVLFGAIAVNFKRN